MLVLIGNKQYHPGASAHHLLWRHLLGKTQVLDPHAGCRLLPATVWYDPQKHSGLAPPFYASLCPSQASRRRTQTRLKGSSPTPTCTSWLWPSSWPPSTCVSFPKMPVLVLNSGKSNEKKSGKDVPFFLLFVSSCFLTSWPSRMTSASGKRKKAWWGCQAKRVGQQLSVFKNILYINKMASQKLTMRKCIHKLSCACQSNRWRCNL